MSTEHPEREDVHLENATIEVGNAELYISPGARRAAHRLAYALVVLFVFTIAIGAANLLFTNGQVRSVRQNTASIAGQQAALRVANAALKQANDSSCAFFRDLGSLPVTPAPGLTRPSETLVAIVVHSRQAFLGRKCDTALPPPGADLRKWAAFYHLPLN
jgi:hypothetical protein